MHTAGWQSFQLPPFRGVYYGDGSVPLQMRNFTSKSYEAVKRRERIKAERRKASHTKKTSGPRSMDNVRPYSFGQVVPELDPTDSGLQGRIGMFSRASHQDEKVPQDSGPAQIDPGLQGTPGSPSTTSTGILEAEVTSDLNSFASVSSQEPPAVSAGYDVATNPRRSQGLFCHDIPNATGGDEHKVPGQDNLSTTTMQLEEIPPAHAEHEGVTLPQPGLVHGNTRDRAEPMEHLIDTHSSPSPTGGVCDLGLQPTAVAAAMQCRAVVDSLPSTRMIAIQDNTTPSESLAATVLLDYPDRTSQASLSASWSNEQDELLIHLRDVAQLDWHDIVRYFPNTLLNTMKHRHRQLRHPIASPSSTQPSGQHRSETAISVAATKHRAPARRRATTMAVRLTTPRRARTAKPPYRPEALASCAPDDIVPRVSRRGRPIKHPFRHRPIEGYL